MTFILYLQKSMKNFISRNRFAQKEVNYYMFFFSKILKFVSSKILNSFENHMSGKIELL